MKLRLLIFFGLSSFVFACQSNEESPPTPPPPEDDLTTENDQLTLKASSEELVDAFDWAKAKALSYAHDGDDPVGKWYEAALPKRKAFCMRDVAHQVTGADVLGLQEHNTNMLYKFAVNISESKDWCSFWEIDKYDRPAPVDYRNDEEFWYNLPANFDVLQAAYSHYLWTGDKQLIKDTAFLFFYEKTLTDYIDRWDLSLDKVYIRKRFMNMVDEVDSSDYFHVCRGIPGYDEGQGGRMTLGLDQLVIMAAGFRAGAAIAHRNGDVGKFKELSGEYEKIESFIDEQWWDPERQSFKTFLLDDGSFKYAENTSVLYYQLTTDPQKYKPSLEDLEAKLKSVNIETASYFPEAFFQYGESEAGVEALLYLCDENTKRREYPEVSFAVVGSVATGLMGLKPDARVYSLMTIPRLPESLPWVELHNVPVLQNQVSLRHTGLTRTRLLNKNGRNLFWKAFFPGNHETINVDGEPKKVIHTKDFLGNDISGVVVNVEPGRSVVVEVEGQ